MKKLPLILTIIISLSMSAAVGAVKDRTVKQEPSSKKAKLSTNVNFEDRFVGGKYQFSTEALAKVENDKSLEDLVGTRKDFSDKEKLYKEFK